MTIILIIIIHTLIYTRDRKKEQKGMKLKERKKTIVALRRNFHPHIMRQTKTYPYLPQHKK